MPITPTFITADKVPLVSYTPMNDTHLEEITLVNQLVYQLTADEENALNTISISIEEWVTHTREHFENENQLMQQYQFPAYPIHSSEHESVLKILESVQQQWLNDHSTESVYQFLNDVWKPWFFQHVNSMDKATAEFIQKNQTPPL